MARESKELQFKRQYYKGSLDDLRIYLSDNFILLEEYYNLKKPRTESL